MVEIDRGRMIELFESVEIQMNQLTGLLPGNDLRVKQAVDSLRDAIDRVKGYALFESKPTVNEMLNIFVRSRELVDQGLRLRLALETEPDDPETGLGQ